MKIGYIVPSCSVSGGMAVICQHVNRLQKRGHFTVMLSTVAVQPMNWFPNQNVPIHNILDWTMELDVVVATSWSTAFWLYQVPSTTKCYFVQSDETRFHADNSRWQHLTAMTYLLRVNYFTEARWIRTWLKENFDHDAALVPNGLDRNIFHACEPFSPKIKKGRVLLEGAIGLPYKGMTEAFEAVAPLDVEIWCVSSYGTPKNGWRCDRFFEHVPMVDMKRIYSSCDILLKLSRVEGFFGPPMEMMACGGASVVGKVTGYDEYIVDGHNALVVDPLNIQEARSAVEQLLNDHGLKQRLIEAGRQTVKDWEWDSSIDILEKYFQGILSNPACWSNYAQRHKHHQSLLFAHNVISETVLPDHIALSRVGTPLPPHALRLATEIVNTKAFTGFADFVRFIYRIKKKFFRIFLGIMP